MSNIINYLLKDFPDIVILTDLNGNVTDLSQSALEFYGSKDKGKFIGKNILDFIHPDSIEIAIEKSRELMKNEKVKGFELKLILNKNSYYFGEITSILIKDNDRKPQYYLTIIKNITETKNILEDLNRSKQMFQLVLDNIPQFIFWKDKDSKFLGCNENFARVAGVGTAEKIVGKYDQDLVWKKEEAESFFEIDRFVMESDKPEYHIIESQLQADGKEAWLDSNKIPLHDSNGNVIGVLGTYEDITERINAEVTLKKSEQSYKNAYNQANFLRDLFSHDMNNILQGIQSGTELIEIYLKSKDEMGIYRILKIILNEIRRGVRLIKNISTFSQIEIESENFTPIEVIKLLKISITNLLDFFQHKKINIKIDSQESSVYVNANDFLIEVFQNIFINAIVFNDNPEVVINVIITIETEDNKSYIKIQFIDNGIGIEDDRKEIVFQRTENMDKQITGLGLGLSLSKKIIEAYNGRIWVEDKVEGNYEEGSKFIIFIPKV
ncbi:MAG: PAS domain S-box protein [Promethearchaeota archaeon]